MIKGVSLFLLFLFVQIPSLCQDNKMLYLSYSWSKPKDSSYTRFENYSGTLRITKDSVYSEIFMDSIPFIKQVVKDSAGSLTQEAFKHNIFFWEEVEHTIRTRYNCDTLRGMQIIYDNDHLTRSFWITNGCFPESHHFFLIKLFDLFCKRI